MAHFGQIWIDGDGHQVTTETERQPLVTKIAKVERRVTNDITTEHVLGGDDLSDTSPYPQGECLSNLNLVGATGLEPVTSRM